MSGSISRGKNDPSQSLQMMERPLMTADELKSLPKGSFIVTKTGANPMRTRLRLFLDWGITFGKPYEIEEKSHRKVHYADREEITAEIMRKYPQVHSYAGDYAEPPESASHRSRVNSNRGGGQLHTPDPERIFGHKCGESPGGAFEDTCGRLSDRGECRQAQDWQDRELAEQCDYKFKDVIDGDFEVQSEVKS